MTRRIRQVALTGAAALITAGCIWTPASGTEQENTSLISLMGYADGSGQVVNLKARNYVTDSLQPVGTVVSTTSETFPGSGLYLWSTSLAAPSRNLWAPPELGIVSLPTPSTPADRSIGRFELHADQAGTPLVTFSETAKAETMADLNAGVDQVTAGQNHNDGTQLMLYDNTGVDVLGESNVFTSTTTFTRTSVPGVQISVVHYKSDGLDTLGMICEPTAGTGRKLIVYNHGGGAGNNPLEANWCVATAIKGFVYAMTAYRAEPVKFDPAWSDLVPAPPPSFSFSPAAGAVVETSLGEVKDTIRFLNILRTKGNVDVNHVLMWGHSHGGSITLRAVEQGARVNAAAALAPATDWAQIWNDCRCTKPSAGASCTACLPATQCVPISGTCAQCVVDTDTICTGLPPALTTAFGGDPTAAPRSYSWRSPFTFTADLKLRKNLKFFIGQGLSDVTVRYTQACKLVSAAWGTTVSPWHVPTGAVDHNLNAVTSCAFSWLDVARPGLGTWPQQTFMVYDDVGHGLSPKMVGDMTNFIDHGGW